MNDLLIPTIAVAGTFVSLLSAVIDGRLRNRKRPAVNSDAPVAGSERRADSQGEPISDGTFRWVAEMLLSSDPLRTSAGVSLLASLAGSGALSSEQRQIVETLLMDRLLEPVNEKQSSGEGDVEQVQIVTTSTLQGPDAVAPGEGVTYGDSGSRGFGS